MTAVDALVESVGQEKADPIIGQAMKRVSDVVWKDVPGYPEIRAYLAQLTVDIEQGNTDA